MSMTRAKEGRAPPDLGGFLVDFSGAMTQIAELPAFTLMVTQEHTDFCSQPGDPLCMCVSFLGKIWGSSAIRIRQLE